MSRSPYMPPIHCSYRQSFLLSCRQDSYDSTDWDTTARRERAAGDLKLKNVSLDALLELAAASSYTPPMALNSHLRTEIPVPILVPAVGGPGP